MTSCLISVESTSMISSFRPGPKTGAGTTAVPVPSWFPPFLAGALNRPVAGFLEASPPSLPFDCCWNASAIAARR